MLVHQQPPFAAVAKMVGTQSLAVVAATAALVSGQTMNPPAGFEQICRGRQNIIQWTNVPHDWNRPFNQNNPDCCKFVDDKEFGVPKVPYCCEGDGNPNGMRYRYKDWWYYGSDWQKRIADGDLRSESVGDGACNNPAWLLGQAITFCGQNDPDCPRDENGDVWPTEEQCRKACAFEYTTEGDIREKCNYFSFDEDNRTCLLFSNCGWPLEKVSDVGGLATAGMKSHRIVNIHPAGFKSFDLREFSEPPVCIWVPGSGDKKVEVMIETEMNDASICIRDGSDMSVGRNMDVGNIETCNKGKLEACFTAATNNQNQNKDFFFMIYCDGSCEASDLDLWLRIRTSNIDWNAGKSSTADDIEMWCEMEKGSTSMYKGNDDAVLTREDYTWPSDLLPKKPDNDPFNIRHTAWMSPASRTSVSILSAAAVLLMALL